MSNETTTSYRWGDGNVITRIDVRQQANGRAVAYLYADEREEARAQRHEIRAAIRLKGWGTLSDHRDGQYALRISGLRDGQELIGMLSKAGYITGEPTTQTLDQAGTKSKGAGEFLKNNSLRASGLIYMIGNAFYYLGGKAAKNVNDQRMAISFAVGDGLLAIFGGRDDARQYKSLLGKLKTHMEVNGIEIPKNASIHVETSTRDDSVGSRVVDFMHSNINAIKILAEVAGGWFAFRSGMKPNAEGKKNPFRILGGLVVMAGWAGALLTPEKKPDEEKLKDAGPVERAVAHIQEKPLRLAGWAGLTFNALTFGGAWGNRGTAAGKYNLGAVFSMVSANGLYSISNKTTGGDIKADAMVSDVYIVAAQILNKQPDNVREAAIESTAQFLGERPEIKDTHQQIIVRLKQEMQTQRQSPWFETRALPPYTPVVKKRSKHREEELSDTPTTSISGPAQEHVAPTHALSSVHVS